MAPPYGEYSRAKKHTNTHRKDLQIYWLDEIYISSTVSIYYCVCVRMYEEGKGFLCLMQSLCVTFKEHSFRLTLFVKLCL